MAAKKWPTCNVFQPGADRYQVWHFDLKSRKYVAKGSNSLPANQPLPVGVAGKGWQSLVQPKLNVAWLPAESVFLRVVQLPQCGPEELAPMVDLQLEKLSPLPVAQIVWSAQSLGDGEAGMQTVLVVIAGLDATEAFLGRIEEVGLLVDRLDVPAVDQLMALKPEGDGAWILPDLSGMPNKALVGWWCGGVLRSLGVLELPAEDAANASLRDQLMQMAWAGEIEGWLPRIPSWHLYAGPETRDAWRAALVSELGDEVEAIEPPAPADLALSSANRSLQAGPMLRGLLPAEYATRYRQQFNDRLWMRSLGAAFVLYVAGILVYFAVLGVENWRLGAVEQQVKALGPAYTNALDLKATFDVLNDLQELKFAALECWRLTSREIPENVTVDGLNFSEGSKVILNGTAPEDSVGDLIDFSAALRNVEVDGKRMFRAEGGEQLTYKKNPRTANVSWNFSLVLKRSEVR